VTATPDVIDGVAHDSTTDVDVCATTSKPLGAGGHVDTVTGVLRLLSPALLSAPTTYVYETPPINAVKSAYVLAEAKL
jgi:hypothetical protein